MIAEPLQAQSRSLRDAHDVPFPGNRVAEGVNATLGVVGGVIQVGENDSRRPDRARHESGLHDPVTHCAGGLISAAAHDRRVPRQAGLACDVGRDAPGHFRRFNDIGQDRAVDFERFDQRVRPLALHHVEQCRAGRVRHLAGELAGQPIADVILREEHLADAIVARRVVIPNPEELRRSEPRQDRIRRLLQDHGLAGLGIDPVDLLLTALVAPDQRGPNHFVRTIEQGQTVHLPGQPHAGDLVAASTGLPNRGLDCGESGVPPVLGALLRPQRLLHQNLFMQGGDTARNRPVRPDQQRPRTAGAYIDS